MRSISRLRLGVFGPTSRYGRGQSLNVLGVRWFAAAAPKKAAVKSSAGVDLNHLRNIGISAHIDSGKTTLTERVLFYTGKIREIHEVKGKDGVGATMDHMELERERGITITSAATYCNWFMNDEKYHINIIDTPGHVDFTMEVERALRVLDGCVMICCGVGGVQSQTITVDRQMRRYGVPRLVFINKLDRYGADPEIVLEQVRAKLGLNCALIQLPIGSEDNFAGVVDLITQQAVYFTGASGMTLEYGDIPADMKERSEERRTELIDILAECDDEFADKYLEGIDLTPDDIHGAIRRATIALKFQPMLCGSAFKNKGVQLLLDASVRYLPSPGERKNIAFDQDKEEQEKELICVPNKPFVGLAFKIQDQPGIGTITYMRVYQGKLNKGDGIVNMSSGKKTSPQRMMRMHSAETREVAEVSAGDIVALTGLHCASGTTFTDGKVRWTCSSMYVPEAVMSLAISAPKNDVQKMRAALKRYEMEDPTFHHSVDPETQEMILSGMGELHLEVYAERMRREHGINVKTGEPRVKYRETIDLRADFDYTYKRQTGGRGQYGKVVGYMEPIPEEERDPDKPIVFRNDLSGPSIPPNFIAPIDKGFKEALATGLLSGSPAEYIRVVLTDGNYHEVDSSEHSFKLAAFGAVQQAYHEAAPKVLEPIMDVEVIAPAEFNAQVLGTISGRRGTVENSVNQGESVVLTAIVPLKDMFGYSGQLRGATQGMGEFSMEFRERSVMPADQQEELAKKNARRKNAPTLFDQL